MPMPGLRIMFPVALRVSTVSAEPLETMLLARVKSPVSASTSTVPLVVMPSVLPTDPIVNAPLL